MRLPRPSPCDVILLGYALAALIGFVLEIYFYERWILQRL